MDFETINKPEDMPAVDDFINQEKVQNIREKIEPKKEKLQEPEPKKEEEEKKDEPKKSTEEPTPKIAQAEQETEMEVDMTFTKELRKATREVHKVSDVLVNAKFAFALTDDAVWADGLLSFYEIYKFLEKNLPEDLLPNELRRTPEFEKDLSYFLGKEWKETYEPRDAVKKYLAHLEEVNEKSKLLLFAYAYQMYMALMSGGQLLQKKRMIARKLWFGKKEDEADLEPVNIDGDLEKRPMPIQVTICPPGCAATYFPEKISVLKNKLRAVLNKHYGQFDEQMKADFIEESRNVFIYNSDVVRSIKGVNRANLKKLAVILVCVFGVYLALKLGRR